VPEFDLPDNFSFTSVGDDGCNPSKWSTDLQRFLLTIEEKHFVHILDDMFVIRPVNVELFNILKEYTKEKDVGEIHVNHANLRNKKCRFLKEIGGMKIFELEQDSPYRAALQPAIWNKEFMFHCLEPGLSPWAFEERHPKNDGWRIISPDNKLYPVRKFGGTRRSNINKIKIIEDENKYILEEDLKELRDRGLL